MSLWNRLGAAVDAWKSYGSYGTGQTLADTAARNRYALLGAFYTGSWRYDPRWPWAAVPARVYLNSRQIVKATSAIVDTYEQLVYQGDLSTDGMPLPDGTRGAIPIDPQTGTTGTDAALLKAFHAGFAMWQWRMLMSLMPKSAAIFGDVLVELVEDVRRGSCMPNFVFSGYVPDADLELDFAGNIKRYAVEYPVQIEASTSFGRVIRGESYLYRKEVDGDAYRYYKDGRPWDDPEGHGAAVQPNPYGFVPAIWCRHELVIGSNRGLGAYEKTLTQAMDLNSTLSSAIDYQRRQFGAPIGVKGSQLQSATGQRMTMPNGVRLLPGSSPADIAAAQAGTADSVNLLPLSDSGGFVTISFDIGQTQQMVDFVHDSLVSENPEATWASKLFGLTQATGPGMQRILSPIIGKVNAARKNHDPQMVKLCQMNTAIVGFRLNRGDYPAELVAARPDRYDAFRPFDLTSFGQGLLDATIPSRDVFPESRAEKAQWLALAKDLPLWALQELGLSEATLALAVAEKDQAAAQAQAAQEASLARAQAQQSPPPVSKPNGQAGPAEAVA